jgi:hypothetical protein
VRLRNALLSCVPRGARRRGPRLQVTGLGAGARRVVVKAHVARLGGRGARAAVLHLRYIERDGVEKDGSKGVLYDASGPVLAEALESPRAGEKHQFRIIVSPEDAAELDLTLYVRRLMAQVEQDLGRKVEWAAVNHYNTEHSHAHLVIRGVDREGRELRLERSYISNGLRIGRAYLLAHGGEVAGAVLSATGWRAGPLNHVLRMVAQREVRRHGARTPSRRMSNLVFGTFNVRFRPTRTECDWLSRDATAVDEYIADPLCGFPCSGQLWADLFAGLVEVEKTENNRSSLPHALPLLLVAGSHDPVSMGGFGHAQLAKRYRAAGNADIDDRRYPEARHELVNETNRMEVWSDIIGWILKHADRDAWRDLKNHDAEGHATHA